MTPTDALGTARTSPLTSRNKGKRFSLRSAITVLMFASLFPATLAFADTSTVTLTITEAPVTRISLSQVYDPAIDGEALVQTTSVIAELP